MSWWEITLASVAYAIPGLVCARVTAGHLAYRFFKECIYYSRRPEEPTTGQWVGAACCGALLGLIWPPVLIVTRSQFERFAVGAEAQHLRQKQADRIRELEQEAGIR